MGIRQQKRVESIFGDDVEGLNQLLDNCEVTQNEHTNQFDVSAKWGNRWLVRATFACFLDAAHHAVNWDKHYKHDAEVPEDCTALWFRTHPDDDTYNPEGDGEESLLAELDFTEEAC